MGHSNSPDEAQERLDEKKLAEESDENQPFRSSGSGENYDPSGSWGTERRLDQPAGNTPHGMEGAASGAGYGGFGPEGDYTGPAGKPNADILGQVNADPERLADEAKAEGPIRSRAAKKPDQSA